MKTTSFVCIVFFAILFAVLFMARSTDAAKGVDLATVQDWVIVVPDGSIPSEYFAAEELQRFYAEASGRSLKIVNAVPKGARGHILVGQVPDGTVVGKPRVTPYEDEEFRIIADRREIVITGGRPRGVLYGVYTFVEDYLGVRFLAADHTHVPRLQSPCLIGPLDRSCRPPIQWRYSYCGEVQADHQFAVRMRQNAVADEARFGGLSPQRLFNHNASLLLPWTQYGAEHPEYFCLRDGKRPHEVREFQTYEIQPCFSNPDARKIMLENLRTQIKKEYPAWRYFSVSQDDNNNFCTCPECAAKDEAAGSHAGQVLDCVNWIAGEIAKEYPDVTIGTLIYKWSRTPPKNIRPASNVMLQLCTIECCQIHPIDDPDCPLNKQFREDFTAWANLSARIAVWSYTVDFWDYLTPCPNLFTLERNVRYFTAHHAEGLFMQAAGGVSGAEFSDLRNYMVCNLLWNPSRSGKALFDEFLNLQYGLSAPPIRRFIERMRRAAQSSGKHRSCYGAPADYGITAELGRLGIVDFREAMSLAPDPATKERVEKASIVAWRLAAWPLIGMAIGGRHGRAEKGPTFDAKSRPTIENFVHLCRRHHVALVAEGVPLERLEKLLEVPR